MKSDTTTKDQLILEYFNLFSKGLGPEPVTGNSDRMDEIKKKIGMDHQEILDAAEKLIEDQM